ncbi:MAG: MarR family transcriptional regulator [Clostridiales bacterium]|nr:MarR family transcriptional regulator [Clostridiales bacterium]
MTTGNELGHLLNKSSRLCKLKVNTELNGFSLTFPQYVLIKYICESEEKNKSSAEKGETPKELLFTPASIAEALGYVRAAITGIIDRLIKLGFVARDTNPYDRRSLVISVTDKGRETIRIVDEFLDETSSNITAGFSQNEIEELAAYLHRVIENMGDIKDIREQNLLEDED